MMIQLTFSTHGRRPIALLRSGLAPVPFAPEYSSEWQDVEARERDDDRPQWRPSGSALQRFEGLLCATTLTLLVALGTGAALEVARFF